MFFSMINVHTHQYVYIVQPSSFSPPVVNLYLKLSDMIVDFLSNDYSNFKFQKSKFTPSDLTWILCCKYNIIMLYYFSSKHSVSIAQSC